MNSTYQDILKKFFHSETTNDYTLEKITRACAFFGNPQNSFKSIHIAGTNGKGSVSKMIFQILKEAWKRVWVYTSPHNIDIRERFETANCWTEQDFSTSPPRQIGSKWPKDLASVMSTESPASVAMTRHLALTVPSSDGLISEEQFVSYVEQIVAYGWGLSYYEKCVLLAFLYFRDVGCEYAVIEVGMWGRLDATNIIMPILSVITSISYDHMEFLGITLEAIAYEKWGIIKPEVPVILYGPNPTLESIAEKQHAPLILAELRTVMTNMLGEHQISNARIAYEAGIFLGIEKGIIERALLHVDHHGRLEYLRSNLLIDGAHNEDGLKKLKAYLSCCHREERRDPEYRNPLGMDCHVESQKNRDSPRNDWIEKWNEIIYSFNLKEGKSSSFVLDIFPEIKDWNIIDSKGFKVSDAQKMAQEVRESWKNVSILTPDALFDAVEKNPRTLFVVFGSLYMMGEFLWK